MILTKHLKVGSRIRIPCAKLEKRCIVEEIGAECFLARPILVDRDFSDELITMSFKESDKYSEWGVTKLYRVTLDVTVDHDYCQSEPDDEEMQNGLDRYYDGSMLIIKSDYQLIDVEENELPEPPVTGATLARSLKDTIAALKEQLSPEEFEKLCEVSRTIAMGGEEP